MKMTICLLAFLSSFGFGVLAQDKASAAVATAVENLRKLMVDPDKAALDKLTAEELSYGHSNGNIQNKAEFIEAFFNGKSDFVSIDLTEQTIKISGNTAIVRHVLSAATNDSGKPGTAHLSVLLIWQLQKGAWKLLARQAVKIAQ